MKLTPYEQTVIEKQMDALRPGWEAYNVLSDLLKKSRTEPNGDPLDEIATENPDVHVPSWRKILS